MQLFGIIIVINTEIRFFIVVVWNLRLLKITIWYLLQIQAIFCTYRVFIKYCIGKTEKGQSPEYFKIFGKNTIFNEQPVCTCMCHHLQTKSPLLFEFNKSLQFSHMHAKNDMVQVIFKFVDPKM